VFTRLGGPVGAGVQICLLGPLQVRCDGVVVAVRAGKQRALLAALLLQPGRVVPAGQLAELLWAPDPPPPTAPNALRNYVLRLRRALGPAGQHLIQTRPGGYAITPGGCELDLALMEQELAATRAAARDGDWQRAAVHAAASLSLWRGEPLSDVDLPALTAWHVPRLTEMRLQARELRIEADLALARHAEAVTELPPLIAAHPLRERLYALLMLALYRCGRRAEALAAYRAARDVLAKEIGADPGPALQALHEQVLHDDPALAAPPAPGGPADLPGQRARAAALPGQVPRQLPAVVACFTGRDAELAALTGLLGPGACGAAPALVISAIGGTAGVGKTALAIQWAHQVAGRFPDGQLYVNLRGYDPDEPVSAGDALAGFLGALGVPGQQIPDREDDRARLYRSRLAGRRMIVVLDNARDGDQVRPLLPGDPGCVAVVTSRDSLAGLVAADGARRLDLDVLPQADAVALLRSLIGGRVDADPDAAAQLAGLCARLPLALRIAAELAAARRETPLRELVTELAADRLDLLNAGEDRADVRAVFSWSVRQLPEVAAGAFALLGLHPGDDFDVYAAAALTGTSPGQARRILSRLDRASLLQAAGAGRHRMHDLLRDYAGELAGADRGDQSEQALTRLFDSYLAAAAAAMDILFPAEAHHRPRILPSAVEVPAIPGEAGARAWLDAERANLVAVVVRCAGRGWHRHAADLAATLFRYLMAGSYLPEARTIYGHALQAARRSGDLAAEARALNELGGIGMIRGHFGDAAGHYRAALQRYRRCGDRAGEARVLRNLGITELQLHNHRSAAGYYQQAIAAYDEAGDSLGAAGALVTLAAAETELGSYDKAGEHLQRALPVFREAHDQLREAEALEHIGWLNVRRGQLTHAAECFQEHLAICRRIDYPRGVAAGLDNLGNIALRRGEYAQASSYLRQALGLCRQTGNQHREMKTLRDLAQALHRAGQPAAARAELQTALRLAAETGNTYQQASVHRDLAESHHSAGEDEHAREHWQQALDLYAQLGAPEADQIRGQLAALSPGLTQVDREPPA
jgi:DNA-binding SARP family transcriptional activator/Tfp pilus assembly protein PilF